VKELSHLNQFCGSFMSRSAKSKIQKAAANKGLISTARCSFHLRVDDAARRDRGQN
jgi:hypothetical protein